MRKGSDIADRLVRFAADAIGLVGALSRDAAAAHVGRQLVRAATAAGAGYEEARGAESRRDFVHKLRIADKEMREARYWLTLIAARWDDRAEAARELAGEADELVAILTASTRTASARV